MSRSAIVYNTNSKVRLESEDEEKCCEDNENERLFNQKGGVFTAQNGIQRQTAYDTIGLLSDATNTARERLKTMIAIEGQQLPVQKQSYNLNRLDFIESKLRQIEGAIHSPSKTEIINENKVGVTQYGSPQNVMSASEISIIQREIDNMEKKIDELEAKLSKDEGEKENHEQEIEQVLSSLKNLTAVASTIIPIVDNYVVKSQNVIEHNKTDYDILLKLMNEIFPMLTKIKVNLDEGLRLYERANSLLDKLNNMIQAGKTENIQSVTDEINQNANAIKELVSNNKELEQHIENNNSERETLGSELNKITNKVNNVNNELSQLRNEHTPSIAVTLALKTKELSDLVTEKEELQDRLNKKEQELANITNNTSNIYHKKNNNNFNTEMENKKKKIAELTNDSELTARLTATAAQITAIKREQMYISEIINKLEMEHKNMEDKHYYYNSLKEKITNPNTGPLVEAEIDNIDKRIQNHVSNIQEYKVRQEELSEQIEDLENNMSDLVNQTRNEYPKINQTRKNNNSKNNNSKNIINNMELSPSSLNTPIKYTPEFTKLNNTMKAKGGKLSKNKTVKSNGKVQININPIRKAKKVKSLKKGARLSKLRREIPPL